MEFVLKTQIDSPPKVVFSSWLSSEGHSIMTGGNAMVSDKVGEKFTAWDGYIEGTNLQIEPCTRIVQSWRTAEFNEEDEDSVIELIFEPVSGVTQLTLIHTNLPDNGEKYRAGWEEHYFQPMRSHFK